MISNNPLRIGAMIQAFFCERLLAQRNASPRTISSYRDTVRLLLQYASAHARRPASDIELMDFDSPLILNFLEDLEKRRGNAERTRNARLAALRSLTKYIALREPTFLPNAERILAIPMKRFDRPLLAFLSREEVEAILAAPDISTWNGRRDHVLFMTFYNTGARVSELVGLKVGDVNICGQGVVRLHGKGRKERAVPLWKSTTRNLKEWLRYIDPDASAPLFPNRVRQPLTRSGVESRLRVAVKKAAHQCVSLKDKRVSPHTFRHTTAMHLLQAHVDIATIALWLGHESPTTTHAYVQADMSMKEAALSKLAAPQSRTGRYRADDAVLAFLNGL